MPKKYAIYLTNSQPQFKLNNPEVNFVRYTVTTSMEEEQGSEVKLVLTPSLKNYIYFLYF